MIVALKDRPADAAPADILIVGGGAVGLSMARALVGAGRRTVLLEAGGRSVDPASQAFFESATSSGYPLEGLHLGRFRLLGGTTNFWSGQLVPFDPIVFERRDWVTDAMWPIGAADLAPWYDAAFDQLGLAKRIADPEVWQRLDIAPPAPGAGLELFFSRWTPETNLARLHEKALAAATDVEVVTQAPVVDLEVDGDGRVVAAIVAGAGGARRRLAARHVVLAQGTIEIARLLAATGAARRTPWSDNPWLGRGYMDHVDAVGGAVTPLDKARFHALFDSAFQQGLKYQPKIRLTSAIQRDERLLDVAAHFLFNSSYAEDLAAMKVFARGLLKGRFEGNILTFPAKAVASARIALPMIARYLRYRRTYNPADRGIQLRITSEQAPLAASRLTLRDEVDAIGAPKIAMHWAVDDDQIRTLSRFATLIAGFLERERLATVALDPRLAAGDVAFLGEIDDANHHMGMARMGAGAADGVVDRDLTVFGTPNLSVAGAAVFPTAGFANPTLTGIALGLRLADRLATTA